MAVAIRSPTINRPQYFFKNPQNHLNAFMILLLDLNENFLNNYCQFYEIDVKMKCIILHAACQKL